MSQYVYHNTSSSNLESITKEGLSAGSFSDRPIDFGGDIWLAVDLSDLPKVQSHQYGNVTAYEPSLEELAKHPIPPERIYLVNKRGKKLRKLAALDIPRNSFGGYDRFTEWLPTDLVAKFCEYDRTNPAYAVYTDPNHLDKLAEDIKQNGFKEPLVLEYSRSTKKALLTEGNHRIVAAQKLDIPEVPVRVLRRERAFDRGKGVPVRGFDETPQWNEAYQREIVPHVPGDMKPSDIGVVPGMQITAGHKSPTEGEMPDYVEETNGWALQATEESSNLRPESSSPKKFKYGLTEIVVPPDAILGKIAIDEADLMGDGMENEPHITVCYGLKDSNIDGLKELAARTAPFTVTLGNTDTFPPSKGSDFTAPIILKVESPELHDLNAACRTAANFKESDYPDYIPHLTLAYVKPEVADKYKGLDTLNGQTFGVTSLVVSDPEKNKTELKLGGQHKEAAKRTPEQLTLWDDLLKTTDTPQFKAWFGNSKIVDKDGKPLIVFHGTTKDFDTFWQGRSLHFTADPHIADQYARGYMADLRGSAPTGANIMPCFLKMEKPLDLRYVSPSELFDKTGLAIDDEDIFSPESLYEMADDLKYYGGYDGIITPHQSTLGGDDGTLEYIVFDSSQVKSAIGNSGKFEGRSVTGAAAPVMQNPNFVRWFGGSKIVDKNGEPQVCYHGTPDEKFDTFEPRESLRGDGGIFEYKVKSPFKFFTPDRNAAVEYANRGYFRYPTIMRVYLKMEHPLDLRTAQGIREADRIFGDVLKQTSPQVDKLKEEVAEIEEELKQDKAWVAKPFSVYGKWDEEGNLVASSKTPRPGYTLREYTQEEAEQLKQRDIDATTAKLQDAHQRLEAAIEEFRNEEGIHSVWQSLDEPESADKLKAAGYDGVILTENNGSLTYAVPDPNQIKAVNARSFNPENSKITASVAKIGFVVQQPIRVYHGTSSDFKKFNTEYLGEGAGGNLYGAGIYLTDNPDVAKGYAERGGQQIIRQQRIPRGARLLDAENLTVEDAKRIVEEISKSGPLKGLANYKNIEIMWKVVEDVAARNALTSDYFNLMNLMKSVADAAQQYLHETGMDEIFRFDEKMIDEEIWKVLPRCGYDGVMYPCGKYMGNPMKGHNYVIYNASLINDPRGKSAAAKTPAREFMAALEQATSPHPHAPDSVWRVVETDGVDMSHIYVGMTRQPDAVKVHNIYASEIGKGYGSQTLQLLCRLADRYGVKLMLEPRPMSPDKPGTLNKQQLVRWYGKYGFEEAGKWMVRKPTVRKTASGKSWWSNPHEVEAAVKAAETATKEDVAQGKVPLISLGDPSKVGPMVVGQYQMDGTVKVFDGFFEDDAFGRHCLLWHEFGHEVSRRAFSTHSAETTEAIRVFRKNPNDPWTYDNFCGMSNRAEEMLADVYSSMMMSPQFGWESDGKYGKACLYVLSIAKEAGLPLPKWYHGMKTAKTARTTGLGSFEQWLQQNGGIEKVVDSYDWHVEEWYGDYIDEDDFDLESYIDETTNYAYSSEQIAQLSDKEKQDKLYEWKYRQCLEQAKRELETKYDELVWEHDQRGSEFDVYRTIVVKDLRSLKTKGIGIYWSWDASAAEAHWGSGGGRRYTFRAHIKDSDVDWPATVWMNLDPSLGNDEKEIRLKEGIPVNITGWCEGRAYGNVQWNTPYKGWKNVTASQE